MISCYVIETGGVVISGMLLLLLLLLLIDGRPASRFDTSLGANYSTNKRTVSVDATTDIS